MCGICGYVGPLDATVDHESARAMRDSLRHRGPDGAGEASLAPLDGGDDLRGWFGHRRLKIIDLTPAAHQPMANEAGSVVLSYNGEVYNFRELRRELEGRGFRFRSSGDTEVVLRAYEAFGEEFVRRLDGMFALAVWDARRARLILARDRVGKKPLFYADRGDRFAFASELKSLLLCPWVSRRMDVQRLPEYLTFGYVPSPHTFYEGVRQVPPASIVSFDRDGASGPREYWNPLPERPPHLPVRDAASRVAELLRSATRRRMVSDVPLGALLSGGVDSSIVVGLMSEVSADRVHTFSIGFPDEPSFDERPAARQVAEHFGTSHTDFAVQLDAVGLMDRLLWHHDQPSADSSAIPTYIVSRLARQHVTVVLNGDGGDEVFGGYDRFVAAALSRRLPPQAARAARRATGVLQRNHGYYSLRRRAERFLELAEAPVTDRYQSWIAVANRELLHELLAPPLRELAAPAAVEHSMLRQYERASYLPYLDQILFANFKTYLPDDLAVKMDRMSMAHSLEARSPFLDTALIEYAARIPAQAKVGIRRLKPVLRRAFAPLLPEAIWNRKKHGFGVPMGMWMRGELGVMFADEVLGSGARAGDLIDTGVAARLWEEHRRGAREHGFRLWTLLTLEHWLRSLERPLSTEPPAEREITDAGVRSLG
jgi:asparagine synthase (glutamine-hydrolysing)